VRRRAAVPFRVLALVLAACTAPVDNADKAPAPRTLEQPAADRDVAAVIGRPVLPGPAAVADEAAKAIEPQAPTMVARRPEAPAGIVIEPLPDLADLLGLGRLQVAKLLGDPSLLREEPPAEVWLYEGALCVLHLFLYEQASGPDYAVRYFEVRGSGDASVGQGICYASLLSEVRPLVR